MKRKTIDSMIIKRFLLNIALCVPAIGSGSVFQEFQQSSTSIAYAHADMAALADDPSTAYFNPAGMTRLCDNGFILGMASTNIYSDFTGKVTFNSTPITSVEGGIITGFLGYDPGQATEIVSQGIGIPVSSANCAPLIGFFHGAYKLPMRFEWQRDIDISVGFSITSPWGYETNYNRSTMNSYAMKNLVSSFAMTPSIAIRFWDTFSIGAGTTRQQLKYDSFTNLFGSSIDYRLENWKWTWNLGFLYELNECTRFGFTYKPSLTQHLVGDLRVGSDKGRAYANFRLPQSFTLGVYQQITDCFDLMATAVYTSWHQFRTTGIQSDLPPIFAINSLLIFPTSILELDLSNYSIPSNLRDTFLIALGGRYWVGPWQIRGGLAYESNPIKKNQRDLRLPENEHYQVGFGLGYHFTDCFSLDFGYQFVYLPKSAISNPFLPFTANFNSISTPIGYVANVQDIAQYTGSTESYAQVISFQIRWDF